MRGDGDQPGRGERAEHAEREDRHRRDAGSARQPMCSRRRTGSRQRDDARSARPCTKESASPRPGKRSEAIAAAATGRAPRSGSRTARSAAGRRAAQREARRRRRGRSRRSLRSRPRGQSTERRSRRPALTLSLHGPHARHTRACDTADVMRKTARPCILLALVASPGRRRSRHARRRRHAVGRGRPRQGHARGARRRDRPPRQRHGHDLRPDTRGRERAARLRATTSPSASSADRRPLRATGLRFRMIGGRWRIAITGPRHRPLRGRQGLGRSLRRRGTSPGVYSVDGADCRSDARELRAAARAERRFELGSVTAERTASDG